MNVRENLSSFLKRHLVGTSPTLKWVKLDSSAWLASNPPPRSIATTPAPGETLIEEISSRTEQLGEQPLWDGYRAAYRENPSLTFSDKPMRRAPNEVRSHQVFGRLYSWLARNRGAHIIVEFGTAFGVSGMYWCSGLIDQGRLLTFEPNEVWHAIAKQNLAEFTDKATAVLGTFEENIDAHLGGRTIDIAFVDAIHSSEFVDRQMAIVIDRLTPKGLVVLDDIDFSDDMQRCWRRWAQDDRIAASASVADHVGILEFN